MQDAGEQAKEGIDKKSCEKDAKKVEAQKKQNPGINLTKFFKPMLPEEKEKLLLNELAKVQQELKAKQQQQALVQPPTSP